MMLELDGEETALTFHAAGLSLSGKQIEQFQLYHAELLKWNLRASLISKKDVSRVLHRHFLESAVLSLLPEFHEEGSVLDLGSGGGFPGMPLAIVRPRLKMMLVDSRRWKVLFLMHLVAELALENVTVVGERAEVLGQQPEFQARSDLVVCRAVAKLSRLSHWSRPLVRPGGKLLAVKGSNLEAEIESLVEANSRVQIDVRQFPGGWAECDKLRVVVVSF